MALEKLIQVAKESNSSDEFIWKIQNAALNRKDHSLLDAVYEFERTNPEKYKYYGWFRIASDFYDLNKKK